MQWVSKWFKHFLHSPWHELFLKFAGLSGMCLDLIVWLPCFDPACSCLACVFCLGCLAWLVKTILFLDSRSSVLAINHLNQNMQVCVLKWFVNLEMKIVISNLYDFFSLWWSCKMTTKVIYLHGKKRCLNWRCQSLSFISFCVPKKKLSHIGLDIEQLVLFRIFGMNLTHLTGYKSRKLLLCLSALLFCDFSLIFCSYMCTFCIFALLSGSTFVNICCLCSLSSRIHNLFGFVFFPKYH